MICSQNEIKYYKDFQLTNFNTLKINSTAKLFYMPDNSGELISIYRKHKDNTPIVIGRGSNVLFSSSGIENPVIHTGLIASKFLIGNTLECDIGVKTQMLSKFALDKKLSGFEFLIGIPASLGGAIYMNASAHGQAISDYLISAKVYDIENNKILNLDKKELNFSYRHSILKEKPYILLSAKFELVKKDKELIRAKMDENLIFRKNRQPNLSLPNAGSVFKNPSDCEFSAGALIDKAGFRGYKYKNLEVYQNHCNFIINKGDATSSDYSELIYEIYKKVKKDYNVELHPEIIYIGKMTKGEKDIWKTWKKI